MYSVTVRVTMLPFTSQVFIGIFTLLHLEAQSTSDQTDKLDN